MEAALQLDRADLRRREVLEAAPDVHVGEEHVRRHVAPQPNEVRDLVLDGGAVEQELREEPLPRRVRVRPRRGPLLLRLARRRRRPSGGRRAEDAAGGGPRLALADTTVL